MYTIQLPSGIDVEIRELTGREEELLTNERLVRTGAAINQVFQACIVRLDEKTEIAHDDILDLLAGDRLALLVELRKISLGAELPFTLKCPNRACGHTQFETVDLAALPAKPYPPERDFTTTLPSGKTVVFCLLNGHHEKRLAAIREPNVTTAMLMRIKSLDDQAPNKKKVADLSIRDRAALRKAMKDVDGGINTQVETPCDLCGAVLSTRVEVEPDFLFPDLR